MNQPTVATAVSTPFFQLYNRLKRLRPELFKSDESETRAEIPAALPAFVMLMSSRADSSHPAARARYGGDGREEEDGINSHATCCTSPPTLPSSPLKAGTFTSASCHLLMQLFGLSLSNGASRPASISRSNSLSTALTWQRHGSTPQRGRKDGSAGREGCWWRVASRVSRTS